MVTYATLIGPPHQCLQNNVNRVQTHLTDHQSSRGKQLRIRTFFIFSAILVVIPAGAAGAGEMQLSGPTPKPAWAANDEPIPLRGVLESQGPSEYRLVAKDRIYVLATPLPKDLRHYAGLNVELRGWAGQSGSQFLLLTANPSEPPQVLVPAWWSLPFVLLLACIALVPFVHKHFWERHYHHIAIGLGLVMVLVYCFALGHYGRQKMAETGIEYFKFIALIGSLFVVTGGILIDISAHGRPWLNTLILLVGAVLANVIGTTGASVLLIRPYLRINKGRIRPFHVVFFIFIVSNCGGALTPIGDPPLFLGYLRGVPFTWTIVNCFPAWAMAVGSLAAVFFVLDSFAPKAPAHEETRIRFDGWTNVLCLVWVLLAVFLDKLLPESLAHYPLGALVMVAAAYVAYASSEPEDLARNEFTFGPLKEVGFLFLGIFATMVPALDYLAANAEQLGITTPGGFYWATGSLSSVLDNAPTYLNFLSAAHGLKGLPLSPENMPVFICDHASYLLAVSLGSVFFGACTYIGNGPNFMVKAIADAAGVETPSFLGYVFRYTLWILLPVYAAVWFVFFSGAVR